MESPCSVIRQLAGQCRFCGCGGGAVVVVVVAAAIVVVLVVVAVVLVMLLELAAAMFLCKTWCFGGY